MRRFLRRLGRSAHSHSRPTRRGAASLASATPGAAYGRITELTAEPCRPISVTRSVYNHDSFAQFRIEPQRKRRNPSQPAPAETKGPGSSRFSSPEPSRKGRYRRRRPRRRLALKFCSAADHPSKSTVPQGTSSFRKLDPFWMLVPKFSATVCPMSEIVSRSPRFIPHWEAVTVVLWWVREALDATPRSHKTKCGRPP